jgi:hypothetical protein
MTQPEFVRSAATAIGVAIMLVVPLEAQAACKPPPVVGLGEGPNMSAARHNALSDWYGKVAAYAGSYWANVNQACYKQPFYCYWKTPYTMRCAMRAVPGHF